MQTIGNLWWLWLLSFIVCGSYTMFNQARRMKGMIRGMTSGDVDQAFTSFGSSYGLMMASGFASTASGILLAISVLVNIFGN